ncbi:hypothetical protein ACXR0O_17845 [Verrucomicrobiota bacterium sgz303538]
MAEIYFQCPVCKQRISVALEATGMLIDCPTCRSSLRVPMKSNEAPMVEVRRRITVTGNTQAELYEEIEKTRGLVLKEHEYTKAARAEAEKLNEELTRIQTEVESVRSEANRHQADAEECRTEAEKARAEATRLQEAEKVLKTELDKMRQGLAAAILDRDTVASRLASAEEAREKANAAQMQLADLRQENAALTALRDEFRLQAERAEASCFSLQERLVSAEKERSEMKAHISLLQVQFEESVVFRRQCELLQQELAQVQAQFTTLVVERDGLKDVIGKQETEIKALGAEIEAKRGESENQRAEMVEVQQKAEATSLELVDVKKQLAEVEKQKADLASDLEVTRKDRDAMKETAALAEANRAELESLRQTATTVAGEKERLQEDLEKTHQENKELQGQLQSSNDRIAEVTSEREQARKDASDRETSLRDALAKAASAIAERERVKEELAASASNLEGNRQHSSVVEERIAKLELEVTRYQEELQEARQAVEKAKAEREQTRHLLAEAKNAARESSVKLVQIGHVERTYKTLIEQSKQACEQERQKLQPLIQAKEQLSEDLKRTREEQMRAVETVETAKKEIAALAAKAMELETNMTELRARLQTVTEERDKARVEAEAVNAGLERTKQHVAALQSRRDQMREEISRLKFSLGLTPEVEG